MLMSFLFLIAEGKAAHRVITFRIWLLRRLRASVLGGWSSCSKPKLNPKCDVIAGLNYLKSRPFVDPARIVMSGCSYGGIQTLLAGERELGLKALVPFAPGAMSWEKNVPLQDRLTRAVDLSKAPVLLIQAENDYSLAPSRVLSEEAKDKKKDFQTRIYPAFGNSHQDGHWGFCSSATDVWGNDVLTFLETQMKPSD